MKPDEIALLLAIATADCPRNGATVRDVVSDLRLHPKRARYLLEKWTRKGYYNYGVSLDMGWLTANGKRVAALVKELA